MSNISVSIRAMKTKGMTGEIGRGWVIPPGDILHPIPPPPS